MRFYRFIILAFGCAVWLTAAPSISAVYNGASWAPAGLPNSGVAQGSIFTLTGSGLGPLTLQQVQSYPLPATNGLAGTTITVSVGGATENCIMIYTSASQVAAILPSATPIGTGTLTLSYQGSSSSISIPVLSASFGTFTLNEAGSGPGVVTDTNYNPITYINTAHPGETLILWGTGLGAITGDETEPPVEVDLGTGVQVLVGNQPATVLYGGRSSSPGLDQINFVVPSEVTGCKVSITVLVKGVTGNITSTSIGPSGRSVCSEPYAPAVTEILQKAVSSGAATFGTVQMSRIGTESDSLTAQFGSYPLNSLIRSNGGTFGPSIGSCISYETAGTTITVTDPIQPTFVDAGADLIVNGPGGATQTVPATSTGYYQAALGAAITPGAFGVRNGAGGSAVSAFTWSLTLPALVTPTNIPASVNRSQDLTLTWSGGSAYPVVAIFLYSGVPEGSSDSFSTMLCDADATSGTFTIPAAVLNLLPPKGYGAYGKQGVDIQIAGVAVATYTASSGLDVGALSMFATSGAIATIQ
jgi:uncharacterized protein (TIGR03437 family)